ncbi:uncharacterized protein Z520_04921 [Fonsecaea multimorphosa CBS 102226]|uniref:Uncharacterized protein n=1 Tax=Fonsecaea multimorphosa CBS 102226 TaxID=1442371 RepID=A0A0D2HBT0_9EURO|nr:uncharacterized protein Z520_04921 [Fonsecaea multimorphosa CBS 102226]KIX99345.1 hypothetical protein Z520_04921 [Fonsecaea multimorphosa CBS 102226]OAL25676.1 hypothetical protein AYO22_04665 [Fonsecaea multimorphosa]
MDSPHDLPDSGRDDKHRRPVTPSGDEDRQPYSEIGLGILTTPPRVLRPASPASRRSAVSSPRSNAALRSDRENNYADQHDHANLVTIALENVVHRAELGRELSGGSPRLPGTTDDTHSDDSIGPNGQAQNHNEKEEQRDRNKGPAVAQDDNTLVAEEKLRLDNLALEKQVKALEGYCETQRAEINVFREKQRAAEHLAETRRQEVVEIRRSKEHIGKELAKSRAHVEALEREIARLRLLEDEKRKLNTAEWQLGDLYGELQQKKAEVSSLLSEVEELRESRELSEKARRRSEEKCKKLREQIKKSIAWIKEAHKQQAQRDMEQYRLYDAHFATFGRRRPPSTRNSVQTSAGQHEILGDFMSSRPQSATSQSLVSSTRQSLMSEKPVLSRPRTSLSGATSPSVLETPARAISASATSQSPPVTAASTTENRLLSGKRVSFHPIPTYSTYRALGSPLRRQSDPYFRRGRHMKPSLPTTLGDDEVSEEGSVSGRSLTMPTTQREHIVLREALQSTTPLPIVWDKSKYQAVFLPEAITPAHGNIPLSVSRGTTTDGTDHTLALQESILRHAAIRARLESGPARASMDTVQKVLSSASSTTSRARTSIPPIESPVSSPVHIVKDGMATSTAIEYPPSPGLRKRQGGISAKTFLVRDLEPAQNASSSRIPLHCAEQENLEDAQETTCMSSATCEQLGRHKGTNGNRVWIPSVRKRTIGLASVIPIIMALCSLMLLAFYTNILPFETPLFCTEARDSPASSGSIRTRLLCPIFSKDSARNAYAEQPELLAKTETVTAWPIETWISTLTETEILTEIFVKTTTQIKPLTHMKTETKTETVTEPPTHTHTEIQTETMTVFIVQPSSFPPTRSFNLQIHSSGSEETNNSSSPSAAEPVPGASPSLERLESSRHWLCSCPSITLSNNQCGNPNATASLSSYSQLQLPRPPRRIIERPTAAEMDERAEKARQRNSKLQRVHTGPDYLGLVPEVQRMLEIWQYKVHELVLGGAMGVRAY